MLSGLPLSMLAGAIAQAAESPRQTPEGHVQQVLVSAQRTATFESQTPVAMTALSGEQLSNAGIDSPSGLGARLPNVHLDGAPDGLRITIRGVSNSDTTEKGDPSAAFMLDGIYIARPQNQNLSFYDVERVEVLRGPQGTLYGRNTTAGVVNVISKTPSRTREMELASELGNYASRKVSAMLNLPLSDALAVRAALAYNKHDSYLRNGQGTPYTLGLDRDDVSARLSAKLAIGKTASLLLRYDYSAVHNNDDSFVPDTNFYKGVEFGKPVWYGAATRTRLTNAFIAPNAPPQQGDSDKTSSGLGAELSWDLGPATLHYLGAHREFEHDYRANFYYRVAPAFALGVRQAFSGEYRQNSHELRIASREDGPLTAQAGLYYFREESGVEYRFRDLELLGLPPYYVFPSDPTIARSKAVFGQAGYKLTPQLRATAGARYTDDDKSRVGSTNFQQAPSFKASTDFRLLNAARSNTHSTTWRLGLDYALTPRTFLYASAATGYKAGGFNDGCLAGTEALGVPCPEAAAVPASALIYQPETLKSYEAGLKTSFWDQRASLNVSAFDYDYRNLQLSGVVMVQGAPRYVTTNAGVASVRGLEIDGELHPSRAGRIHYALTLLDAHYDAYRPDGVHSWAGSKLDRAPSQTLTLGYEHRFAIADGQLKAGLASRRSGAYTIGVPSQLLQYRIPARTESDINLSYRPNGASWSVQAFLKNLENKVQPISIDSFGMTTPSNPRTVAVRLAYRY